MSQKGWERGGAGGGGGGGGVGRIHPGQVTSPSKGTHTITGTMDSGRKCESSPFSFD